MFVYYDVCYFFCVLLSDTTELHLTRAFIPSLTSQADAAMQLNIKFTLKSLKIWF